MAKLGGARVLRLWVVRPTVNDYKVKQWHARRDSNPRPLVPKTRSGHLVTPDSVRSEPIQS